ncbi:MAG TPA: hypothetical protein DCP63_09975 [Bacteroidetes bacterium]|nr:hypothetical protein [Bacteroidota bacterium]
MPQLRNLILLILSFTIVLTAHAQEEEEDTLTVELGEVVVTGARGGGGSLLLPMAIGVIDAREFSTSRRFGLNDALWAMPGVLVQSRGGGQDVRLTVRGFGARGNGDRSNAGTVRGVKILMDGFPETEPDGRTSLDLIDLHAASRIEVLRTNASTLFGNASGGVINIESMPFFSEPFIESSNSFGSFGLRRNSFRVGAPLSSGRFLFSLSNSEFDGWRGNSSSASTQFHSSARFDVEGLIRLRLVASGAQSRFQIPGPLTQYEFDADPRQANPTYASRNERRFNRVGRLGFSISRTSEEEHSFEVLAYVSPKVLERSERSTYRDFNRYHAGGGASYQWKPANIEWQPRVLLGLDEAYQDGSILFYNLVNGERGDSLRTNKREGANTFGIFAQVDLRLLENLSLTFAGRYDRQTYISELFAAGTKSANAKERLEFNHFTPKAALLYRLSGTHSVYISIGGGLESPTFNEVDPPPALASVELNPFLKPMTSTTYEAGFKGVEAFQGHLFIRGFTYSFAAYAIDISDEIVPFDGGAWFFSAGASRRRGFEFGSHIDFRYGLSLRAAFTFLDARYVTYSNEFGDLTGHNVPGIPPTVLNLRLRYAHASGAHAEFDVDHIGGYDANDQNTLSAPTSFLLNVSAGYPLRTGSLAAQLFLGVSNVTDRRVAASAFINPTTKSFGGVRISPSFLEPGLPRNIFGGIDLRFEL